MKGTTFKLFDGSFVIISTLIVARVSHPLSVFVILTMTFGSLFGGIGGFLVSGTGGCPGTANGGPLNEIDGFYGGFCFLVNGIVKRRTKKRMRMLDADDVFWGENGIEMTKTRRTKTMTNFDLGDLTTVFLLFGQLSGIETDCDHGKGRVAFEPRISLPICKFSRQVQAQ